jgi:3-ketosteroid 9alpha-monooxygenase subunit B
MSSDRRPGHVLTVIEVVEETADARSLVFQVPEDLTEIFAYEPGQFLTLSVPSRQEPTARCYSLASSPYLDEPLKVTVKRTAGGYASNLLCDYPVVPFNVEVLKPSGSFTPHDLDVDMVLFAGGSGITPVFSILTSVLHAGDGSCHLFYANRDAASTIFADRIAALAEEFPTRLVVELWNEDEHGGFPTTQDIEKVLAHRRDVEVFTCGPAPFMELVRSVTRSVGFPHGQVHFEEFVSLGGDPFAPVAEVTVVEGEAVSSVEVELEGQSYTLGWPAGRTLVDVMLNAGLDVPYSCRSGECGSCVCTLVEGSVDPGGNELLDPEDIQDGLILGCQSTPTSASLKVEF